MEWDEPKGRQSMDGQSTLAHQIELDAASITTTVRKKGTLSTPSWLSAYTLDSFVALRSVKRFPPKTDQIEEASL